MRYQCNLSYANTGLPLHSQLVLQLEHKLFIIDRTNTHHVRWCFNGMLRWINVVKFIDVQSIVYPVGSMQIYTLNREYIHRACIIFILAMRSCRMWWAVVWLRPAQRNTLGMYMETHDIPTCPIPWWPPSTYNCKAVIISTTDFRVRRQRHASRRANISKRVPLVLDLAPTWTLAWILHQLRLRATRNSVVYNQLLFNFIVNDIPNETFIVGTVADNHN